MFSVGEMEKHAYKLAETLLSQYIKPLSYILEVGCGDGEFLKSFLYKRKDLKAMCIDPHQFNHIEYGITFYKGTAETVIELEETFHIIFTIMSLHHFIDIEAFFVASNARLIKGGKIIVIDWKKGIDTGIPEKYFSLDEIETVMKKTNFAIEEKKEEKFHFYLVGSKEEI